MEKEQLEKGKSIQHKIENLEHRMASLDFEDEKNEWFLKGMTFRVGKKDYNDNIDFMFETELGNIIKPLATQFRDIVMSQLDTELNKLRQEFKEL